MKNCIRIKFVILALCIGMVLFAPLKAQETDSFPFWAGFLLEDSPTVNQKFTLVLVIRAIDDAPSFRFSLEIPPQFEILSDTSSFIVELSSNDSLTYPFTFRILEEGAYKVTGNMKFITGNIKVITDYYIISSSDTAVYGDNPVEGVIYNFKPDTIITTPVSGEENVRLYGTLRFWDINTASNKSTQDLKLRLSWYDNTGSKVRCSTYTNASGYYEFNNLPSGRTYTLEIVAQNTACEVHPMWYCSSSQFR